MEPQTSGASTTADSAASGRLKVSVGGKKQALKSMVSNFVNKAVPMNLPKPKVNPALADKIALLKQKAKPANTPGQNIANYKDMLGKLDRGEY